MPKKPTFTKKQLTEFRNSLMTMRREVQHGIKQRLASKREIEIKDIGDQFDDASEGREQEFGFLMNSRDRDKMMKIEEALRRLDDGSYGVCEECEEPIGLKRIKAMPFTRLCLKCQEEEEQWVKFARERELEEDERQIFELAETEFQEGEEVEE